MATETLADQRSAVLRPINPLLGAAWDDLLARREDATVFHTSAWARVLCESYHYQPCYFAGSDEDEPAILCAIEVDSWLTGRRGISLPFTDECRFIPSAGFGGKQLIRHALNLGRGRQWRTFELRGCEPPLGDPPSLSFYQHSLELTAGADALFTNFESSVRRAIRKAERSKLKVEVQSTFESVREYYDLHCLTRQKHGLPPQPFLFFQNIYRHLISQGSGFIATAYAGNRPAAAALFLHHGNRAHYKFGASNPAFDDLRPSNLAMWTGIRQCVNIGLDLLDFGRTSIQQEGLRRYKLHWGAKESLLHYQKWNCSTGAEVTDSDGSSGIKNTIFRLLPPSVNRLLGAFLYPHIA